MIGGGISGLAAALQLQRVGPPGLEITVLEASQHLGGKIADALVDDVVVEQGADSFLARDPIAVRLAHDVGLESDLAAPAVFGATIWSRGRVVPVPPKTIASVPCSPWATWRSGLISARSAARMARDFVALRRVAGSEMSLGELVEARLGRAPLETVTDPLLAGSRAGLPHEISLAAGAREVFKTATSSRSLMLGLRRAARTGTVARGVPEFRAPRARMGELVQALQSGLGADIRLGTRATRVTAHDARVAIETGNGETITAAAAIVAVPAFEAAHLLADAPEVERALARMRYASLAVVTLTYLDAPPSPLAGSGMLVPSREQRTLSACTWYSVKWPHRVPSGRFVARAVVGRAGRDPALDLGDDDLVRRVAGDLHDAVGLPTSPRASYVTRWDKGLPELRVGHLELVEQVSKELAAYSPRIKLAGAALSGSGIPDCIRGGFEAAGAVAEHLAPSG